MKSQDKEPNHPDLRERTQNLASHIYDQFSDKRESLLDKTPIRQLLRCSSAVAANFRTAIQVNSEEEFYSKICLVTDGCDETLFWLDFLVQVRVLESAEIEEIRREAEDLMKIFTKVRVRFRYRVESLE
jgi:four helix bundle protein